MGDLKMAKKTEKNKIYIVRKGLHAHYLMIAYYKRATSKYYILDNREWIKKENGFLDYDEAQKTATYRNEQAIIERERQIKKIQRINKKNKQQRK